MAELNFYWRMGDYALEAVPKRLARFKDEPNETVDLVKYYQYQGRECKYSIGYFWYNEHEPCWELKFVGERFKELRKTDLVAVFEMLAAAYDTLEAWKNREEDGSADEADGNGGNSAMTFSCLSPEEVRAKYNAACRPTQHLAATAGPTNAWRC